jgi:hypothetical protein
MAGFKITPAIAVLILKENFIIARSPVIGCRQRLSIHNPFAENNKT